MKFLLVFSVVFLTVQCKNKAGKEDAKQTDNAMESQKDSLAILQEDFGQLPSGESIQKYTMTNANGMAISVINYGGIITNLEVPDKDGKIADVVLGFNSLEGYLTPPPYFGAIIGRFGNRIAKGKFSLDGTEYTLAQNDGQNHLHGGNKGFDKVVWEVTKITNAESVALQLHYLSKDMEEGYPGNLNTTVTYTLTNDNTLKVNYKANTDKKTVVNLTQHSYFNLSGDFSKDILGQQIAINADTFLPVDATLIPTGEFKPVAGTPFDFKQSKTIGKEINQDTEQLKRGLGYDHCWVLNRNSDGLSLAATAYDPGSGRFMEVYTTEPGIQFYSGNFLDGTLKSKSGGTYAKRSGFCLETQHYPDSPNQENFPSVVLNPEQTYTSETTFKFSVK
jgi:aldose 1-epimerase